MRLMFCVECQSKVKQAYPGKTGIRVPRTQAEVVGPKVLGNLKWRPLVENGDQQSEGF